jgi:hypothetical protein
MSRGNNRSYAGQAQQHGDQQHGDQQHDAASAVPAPGPHYGRTNEPMWVNLAAEAASTQQAEAPAAQGGRASFPQLGGGRGVQHDAQNGEALLNMLSLVLREMGPQQAGGQGGSGAQPVARDFSRLLQQRMGMAAEQFQPEMDMDHVDVVREPHAAAGPVSRGMDQHRGAQNPHGQDGGRWLGNMMPDTQAQLQNPRGHHGQHSGQQNLENLGNMSAAGGFARRPAYESYEHHDTDSEAEQPDSPGAPGSFHYYDGYAGAQDVQRGSWERRDQRSAFPPGALRRNDQKQGAYNQAGLSSYDQAGFTAQTHSASSNGMQDQGLAQGVRGQADVNGQYGRNVPRPQFAPEDDQMTNMNRLHQSEGTLQAEDTYRGDSFQAQRPNRPTFGGDDYKRSSFQSFDQPGTFDQTDGRKMHSFNRPSWADEDVNDADITPLFSFNWQESQNSPQRHLNGLERVEERHLNGLERVEGPLESTLERKSKEREPKQNDNSLERLDV